MIVLAPRVEHRLAIPCSRHQIDTGDLELFDQQPMGEQPVIVVGRLACNPADARQTPREPNQVIEIGSCIRHPEATSLAAGYLDPYRIPIARDVDRHEIAGGCRFLQLSYLGSLLRPTDQPKGAATFDGWHSAGTMVRTSYRGHCCAAASQLEMALINPAKLRQNGVNESFNGKCRDACPSMEWFANRTEANAAIGTWGQH